jgi:hypothetical protein
MPDGDSDVKPDAVPGDAGHGSDVKPDAIPN